MLSRACTTGHLHHGEAKGKIRSIEGISTYYAVPPGGSKEHAILILTDVMGHKFINNQLLADNFAANGYFVVMPDLFQGDAVSLNRPDDFDVDAWLKNHLPKHIDPVISTILQEMSRIGCKKIGAAGYCLGGRYVARFLKPDIFQAGFVAHPSNMEAEDVLEVEGPLSLACADNDDTFTTERRHQTERLLRQSKKMFQVTLYSDVVHGFAVRAESGNRRAKFAKEQAFLQAIQWFDYHVKGLRRRGVE
ncbi:dienelactone hydrolase [Biscogniauxia mediterranea]|nr:dienelactone hydrolase [Biscogniauxia mediterranea]